MNRPLEVSAPYARLVLQSGVASPAELLRGTHLSERDVAKLEFIGAVEVAQLFGNYEHYCNDPTWTAKLGAQLNIAAHGPLGFAALSAPTLGEALDVMADLYQSRNTAMSVQTQATGTHYRLELGDVLGDPNFLRWMAEIIMKIVEALLASILGHPVGESVNVCFAQPEPSHYRELAGCYDGTVVFGQNADAIEVPLAWRQLPSPLYDEAVYRANLIKCRELIMARDQSGSVTEAVCNHLRNHFDGQYLSNNGPCSPPTLEQMAATLHTTSRTLIRRLQREEHSYKKILETLRGEYAERLLLDARLTAADVGEILGYGEAANFGRAFRRWCGQSPAAWRRMSRT